MKMEKFGTVTDQKCSIGSFRWRVPRLFELARELPVMDIPLDHISLSYDYQNLSLRQIVGHMISVREADLSFPIILDEDGDIMDGRHRLMKALLRGDKTIKAVRFEKNPEPCQVVDDD